MSLFYILSLITDFLSSFSMKKEISSFVYVNGETVYLYLKICMYEIFSIKFFPNKLM